MTRVLVASDKFKGSLTALEVGEAVRSGLQHVCPAVTVDIVPVADGGDGTLTASITAGYRFVPVTAAGPTGEPVETGYTRRNGSAIIEMADISGLGRLPGGVLAPLTAGSRGTGQLIAAALDAGCDQITLGVGGSACTDGGAGMLAALGARLLDADNNEIVDGSAALAELVTVDLGALHPGLATAHVVVASDVDNPLTGPRGAAAVYGPQKGASAGQVRQLDSALEHWAATVAAATGQDRSSDPGAGAAGGVGFAALAVLGADLRAGVDLVLDLVGFEERLADATLVITGEGSLDEQTLNGKAPVGVAHAARATGIPTVAVCGRRRISDHQLRAAGIDAVYSLLELEPDLSRCIQNAGPLLEVLAQRIATEYLIPQRRDGAP